MNFDTSNPASSLDKNPGGPVCPRCGHAMAIETPECLCALRLYALALEPLQYPTHLGGYALELLGEGGMGIVFRGRHTKHQHTVALKMIRSGELATEEEVRRFHEEVEAAIRLEHENVVPVYSVGEDEGLHYFTMKLMKGGSLADHIDRYRGDSRRTAELVATLAKAVHHAHQQLMLHRDLKPANILLDEDGKPHVADFGLAQHFDHPGGVAGQAGRLEGSPAYMAAEQARGEQLTVATDVYGIGVILFELLTGRPPFDGKDKLEILDRVQRTPAPDPRLFDPKIDAVLAKICLRCLDKHPENRYPSAEALAQEIQKYLRYEPVGDVGPLKRTGLWSKRHPLLAVLVIEAVLLLVVASIAVFSGAAAQEKDRREEVLRANEYAARWVAGTVLFKLNGYRDAVAQAAKEFPREHLEVLRQGKVQERGVIEEYCKKLQAKYQALGESSALQQDWFVLSKDGTVIARWTPSLVANQYDVLGRNYAWRDYFKGAWKLGEARSRSAYISRAILSEPNRTQRYVISAPVYDEKGDPIGVLITTTNTGSALGTLDLKDPSDTRHIAMVVALRDNNRETQNDPLPEDHVILVHDSLEAGTTTILKSNAAVHGAIASAKKSLPNRGFEQLLLTNPNAVTSDEAFCDPVMDGSCVDALGKTRAGRWLAGFAPIGTTGFVAIVETPRESAAAPNQTLARRLLLWGGLPFFLGTALVAAAMGIARKRGTRGTNRFGRAIA